MSTQGARDREVGACSGLHHRDAWRETASGNGDGPDRRGRERIPPGAGSLDTRTPTDGRELRNNHIAGRGGIRDLRRRPDPGRVCAGLAPARARDRCGRSGSGARSGSVLRPGRPGGSSRREAPGCRRHTLPGGRGHRRGLGTKIIEDGLTYESGGSVDLQFRPSGVRCEIDIPLPTPSAASAAS